MSDKYNGTDANIAAKKMLDICGIEYRPFKSNNKNISLNI